MSVHVIKVERGHKVARPITSKSEYLALRGSSWQLANLHQARGGDEAAKRRLVQMNYSCIPNADGTLKGSRTPSMCVGMDVDFDKQSPDYAQLMQSAPARILAKKEELGLLLLERSVNKGYHLVFKRKFMDGLADGRVLENQEMNLRWASDLLGLEFDKGAKDITRVFFTTSASAEDLLYLDEAIFELGSAEGAKHSAVSTDSTTEQKGKSANQDSKSEKPLPNGDAEANLYDGIPYSAIVEALENQLGGVPAHGSRNQFIFTMACHLRYICNDDAGWIARVLPDYGERRDKWLGTIKSAASRSQNKSMPKVLRTAIEMARATEAPDADEQGGALPPPMPKKLPPLIKLLVSKTPRIYQPAVAHAVFPALAAHLWRTRFRYIDNVEHEATLMNVLMAGTGAGKNCIAAPIDCILKDIRERDALSLEKERQWKEEMQTKGANKDKKKRPEGIVVQEVDADMTNAAFVLRLSEAEEHFLYVRMNEIDQFDALKTSARSKSQFQIMCLAFDPGNSYGQTRVGTQSVSARVCIRFNWNASTTLLKGQQYFRPVLTDGPISRINFCTIPEQAIGAEMPVYGAYDAEFHSMLKPYIDRLCAARGLVECPQATRLAKKLKEENADFARLSQSRTYENLSFRANVIAYLKAMVLYVAQGEQWDKTTEDFIRWSERYDLWCKMKFFGEAIDEANGYTRPTQKRRGPRNMLDELPDRFTLEEVVHIRRQHQLPSDGTQHMIASWKSRGYILEAPKTGTAAGDIWVKSERYKSQITVSQLF